MVTAQILGNYCLITLANSLKIIKTLYSRGSSDVRHVVLSVSVRNRHTAITN